VGQLIRIDHPSRRASRSGLEARRYGAQYHAASVPSFKPTVARIFRGRGGQTTGRPRACGRARRKIRATLRGRKPRIWRACSPVRSSRLRVSVVSPAFALKPAVLNGTASAFDVQAGQRPPQQGLALRRHTLCTHKFCGKAGKLCAPRQLNSQNPMRRFSADLQVPLRAGGA
jgi:hypothetical protein